MKETSRFVTFALSLLMAGSLAPIALAEELTAVESAVENTARPDADRQRDVDRKPAEVLEFFGIEPGMRVIDVFAGAGYYSEILSYLVGDEGEVALYNNGGWDDFVGDGVVERLEGSRLPNVKSIVAEANRLSLQDDYYDAAVFVLGFHDLYYSDGSNWPPINPHDFVARLYAMIKPGGTLGIVDHVANPGVSVAVADSLHRIDPGIIISDLVSAGFSLEAQSSLLRNSADDRSKPMSDPSVRGKTDRVVMRFKKPEL